MFTDKQTQLLKLNLNGDRVKTRQQGNITLSYLEGFDIIEAANFAFGFGNWGYEVKELTQVSEETNQNQNKIVGYKAIITITVFDMHHKSYVVREDVGYGTGISKDYASAHEGAGKEAVTDGLKRAFRTYGNFFGNALYDKSQKNVDHAKQPKKISQTPTQVSLPSQQNDPYAPLRQLGLDVIEQNGELIITGQTYGKQDTIKGINSGFRWDSSRKLWYKLLTQEAA